MTGPPPASWAVDPDAASAKPVVPGVWRMRLPLGWEHIDHVNAYVVERDDGVMLVDCGPGGDPSCLEAFERALSQTGHDLGDVRALTLTHAHSDHCGLARTVLWASGAELWAHPGIGHLYDVLRDPEASYDWRRRRSELEGVPAARLDAFADTREETTGVDGVVEPAHLLRHGVEVPSALGPWEVIETPGHAPSHVSLLQREHGLLLAGDILCVVFVPWFDYGWTADPFGESVASVDRLAELSGINLTLPGHGRPIPDLSNVITAHRDGFAARLGSLREALDEGPRGGYELSQRSGRGDDDTGAVESLSEVLSLLRHLRLGGHVARTLVDGRHEYRQHQSEERPA
jgi:glyoxylase-like metal-dependent hydrolase (beta-lactamase superfamily II)